MSEEPSIAERFAAVRARIGDAARRAGRRPEEITLVGASKRQAPERVIAAVRAGLARVGESYAQEALPKLAEVQAALEGSGVNAPRWHFIGRLQSNKARALVGAFDVVETVMKSRVSFKATNSHFVCKTRCRKFLTSVQ